jgi:hypothetical protein
MIVYTYTATRWRAILVSLARLCVGGGVVEWGPVRIVVAAEPGKADEVKEPVSP